MYNTAKEKQAILKIQVDSLKQVEKDLRIGSFTGFKNLHEHIEAYIDSIKKL
jgi:hypothetical protein